MEVFQCGGCGGFSAKRPTRVEVINPETGATDWSTWLCRVCTPSSEPHFGRSWTATSGGYAYAVERLPREADRPEGEG